MVNLWLFPALLETHLSMSIIENSSSLPELAREGRLKWYGTEVVATLNKFSSDLRQAQTRCWMKAECSDRTSPAGSNRSVTCLALTHFRQSLLRIRYTLELPLSPSVQLCLAHVSPYWPIIRTRYLPTLLETRPSTFLIVQESPAASISTKQTISTLGASLLSLVSAMRLELCWYNLD